MNPKSATELVVWGAVVHLAVDWLLQSTWMAERKTTLTHPAAYVHAGLHAAGLMLVFTPVAALVLGVAHLLIDARRPLTWWARVVSAPSTGAVAMHVEIWRDQTLHLLTIAIAALIVS